MATKLAIIKQIPMSLQEMKKRINAASFNQWREQWNSIPRCLTRFKPEMGEIAYCDIRRRSQVTMTRLRLGTTLYTHGHYFSNAAPKRCPACDEAADLRHIFVECENLSLAQTPITDHCNSTRTSLELHNILSPPFPADLILQFLRDLSIDRDI